MKKFLISAGFLAVFLSAAMSQPESPPPAVFPLDEVKPGQRGIGKTIFEGVQIEEFEVEILGVLENISPQQNLILGRLHGEKVARTGVFAGMSGSPVFIDDRLVGAVAYAFPFSKEPIAGITPIAEMIDIFKTRPPIGKPRLLQAKPASTLYGPQSLSQLMGGLLEPLEFEAPGFGMGRLRPIATPLTFSGFSRSVIARFAPMLTAAGMSAVGGLSGGRANDYGPATLEGGATVNVQLLRGDFDISASGTATLVSGNQVYAFGHPFLGIGFTDMPLNLGAVLAVIPSLESSQKITAATDFVGSIRQDRATGILGIRGVQPKLLPVDVRLKTSRNSERNYKFEVVTDSFLTPLMTTLAVLNTIASSERTVGGHTLQVECRIALKDQPEVLFKTSVSDMANGPVFAALSAAAPLNFLLTSGFEDLQMERVSVEISSVEETRQALLDSIWVNKVEVKPGEEIDLTVFLRTAAGEVVSESYPIKIPEEIPPGPLEVLVGEGVSLTKMEKEGEAEFIPENLSQLVRAINNLKKNDRLYIRLFRQSSGAVVAGEGLPALPPSMLELLRSDRTAGSTKPINRVIFIEHELPATDFVLSGNKTLKIQVEG